MGCCNSTENCKEEIINIYWSYMPIRKVSLNDYTDEITKINDFSKQAYDNLIYRINKYVLYGDENCQKATKKLFNNLYTKYGAEWVIFNLAFLTIFNDNSALNKLNIIELDKHLKLGVIQKDIRKFYIDDKMFRKFYKIYISTISENCVDPILDSNFADEYNVDEFRNKLHNRYREEIIDLIIDYHIFLNALVRDGIVNVDEFMKYVSFLNNDEDIRKLLEDANVDMSKFSDRDALCKKDVRKESVGFDDEPCDDIERYSTML
jgi:hypothetical protein